MNKLTLNDYTDVINEVVSFMENLPYEIRPNCIIHNGHINNPGISDIDLILGFNDNFLNGRKFLNIFSNFINNLENKDIFFHHMPLIYPISSLKLLPSMTYNPTNELKLKYGDLKFDDNDLSDNQNLLNSLEQTHNRLFILIKLLLSNQKNLGTLLLVGHSIQHSLSCLDRMIIEYDINDFKYYHEIETLRKKHLSKYNIEIDDFKKVNIGLIQEFFIILKHLYNYAESKIIAHFTTGPNYFNYDDNFILIDLDKKYLKKNYNVHVKNSNILVEGFSWITKCLYENYFESEDNFKTVFKDQNFQKDIFNRAKFHKEVIKFNLNNFGSPIGKSSLRPFVIGKLLLSKALKDFEF